MCFLWSYFKEEKYAHLFVLEEEDVKNGKERAGVKGVKKIEDAGDVGQ